MGLFGIEAPKWLDEAARGAVTLATGGISEVIKTGAEVISGQQSIGDAAKEAPYLLLGAPVQAAIGGATVVAAGVEAVTGDSTALDFMTKFRDDLKEDPTKSLGLAASIVGAGAAIGAATGGSNVKLPNLGIANPRMSVARPDNVAEVAAGGAPIAAEPVRTPLPVVSPEDMAPGRHGIVNEFISFVEKGLGIDVPGFGIGK